MTMFDRIANSIVSCAVVEKLYSEKVKKQLRILYPSGEIQKICRDYYQKKWCLLLKIWFIGMCMIIVALIAQKTAPMLMEGNKLIRGETAVLKVYDEEDRETEISYDVQEQMFTAEEIEEHTERFLEEYETLICGENESLQEVHTNLVLQENYPTYPMNFAWESTDYKLVGDDGTVGNENLTKAEEVQLTVCITYDKSEFVHMFYVRIVPPFLTPEQEWQADILSEIQAEDEKQKYKSNLQLPTAIEGKTVRYEAKEDNSALLILVFLPVISVLLYYAKDRDLEKDSEMRKKRLGMKYPEFVSKFQLLLGTGMNVRNIFVKLSMDEALGKELMEETEILVRDMKNGMSVKDATDRFAKRTSNPLYIKFSALLVQNMKKGTDDLTDQLSKEVSEAFILRKMNARRQGEEVGTKLLGPMILMLGVVLIVLMVPAFLSFQF